MAKEENKREENFERLYSHFIVGFNDFKYMSRLERFEYASQAMINIRDYLCGEEGIKPSTVKTGGFVKTPGDDSITYNNKAKSASVVSCSMALLSRDIGIDNLYFALFHEFGHVIDARKGMTEYKEEPAYKLGYNPHTDIVAWFALGSEKFADGFAREFLIKLFDHAIRVNPEDGRFMEAKANFEARNNEKMAKHDEAQRILERELDQKQQGLPIDMQAHSRFEFSPKSLSFASLLTKQNSEKVIEGCTKKEHWWVRGNNKDRQYVSLKTIQKLSHNPKYSEIMTVRDFSFVESCVENQQNGSQSDAQQQEGLQHGGEQTSLTVASPTAGTQLEEVAVSSEGQELSPDAQRDLEYFKLAENPQKVDDQVEDNSAVQTLEPQPEPPPDDGGDSE